jgi:putative nucleotidyltransferase with HDIG domain
VREGHPGGVAADADGRPDAELGLAQLDRLPTLSAVALRVLQVTTDSQSAAADVVRVVRCDQSLTAKIISLAGSSWSGARGPVTTLDQAIPRLGFRTVRSIVLSVTVFDCFPANGGQTPGAAFDRSEFWKHSLAVACASRRLAAIRSDLGVDSADAFVAGLLHDLGKVALSAVFPQAYERLSTQVNQSRGDIADFERSTLGMDHTVAGRRLAERWRLPRELQQVIWLHHLASETLPAAVTQPALVGIAQLADALAREQRIGYSGNYTFYEGSPRLAERLGFQAAQVDAAVHTLVGDVAELSDLLGLGGGTPDALYVQAIARANTELGRLNTELSLSSQRLAAGARYFRALSRFDEQLDAWSNPSAVVSAIASAAAVALQRTKIGAFGLRDNPAAVDLCWTGDESERASSVSRAVPAEIAEWVRDSHQELDSVLVRAPAPVQAMMEAALRGLGQGILWLIPIVHDGKVTGGIVFASEADERARLSGESEDLRCFVASLGLALGRANAQAAARRLSDDLAETNRRLQQMQAELLRSRTLSMIAEMAAGAGHELNSPLTVISGRAQMLAKAVLDPGVQQSLNLIRLKAHECSEIVSELMDFARPRPPQPARVNLAELLGEARTEWLEASKLPPETVQLEIRMADTGLSAEIQADRKQIKTVIRELLANATDAIADNRGSVAICCRPAVCANLFEITVKDTGTGMTPDVLHRAFDPFFSHRQAGRGRGLGLPRASRFVEGHGGRIWLESIPGEGTTAHVLLPRTGPAAASAAQ